MRGYVLNNVLHEIKLRGLVHKVNKEGPRKLKIKHRLQNYTKLTLNTN